MAQIATPHVKQEATIVIMLNLHGAGRIGIQFELTSAPAHMYFQIRGSLS